MVEEKNPYTCLGLLPGSPAADIKRRYRQLAKLYHPDANRDAGAEDKLRDLNAAYAFLSDPARKSAYDAACAVRNAVFVPTRVPQPVPRPHRRRGPSPRRVAGITLLLLLSTGVGVFISTENTGPTLSRLFSQMSGKTVPNQPNPNYTFLPSHGAFDDAPVSNAAPGSVAPDPPAPDTADSQPPP